LVTQIAQYNWRTQWIKTEAGSDVQQCSDEQKLWVSHEGVRLLGCKSIEKPERGYSRVVVSITFKALLIWYLRSFLSSQLLSLTPAANASLRLVLEEARPAPFYSPKPLHLLCLWFVFYLAFLGWLPHVIQICSKTPS
jgi:hypothetical protein